MSSRVVTFGEIMLRLKAPGVERLLETSRLEATFGGAEANVAVALASWGVPTAFVTCLPENHPIAEAAIAELDRSQVDTSRVIRRPGRLGVYYLETAEDQHSYDVVYDRQDSAIAQAKPGDFDWPKVFAGTGWFHITGVTPAISASGAELSENAIREAREAGLTVSLDLNYRHRLWRWGRSAPAVLEELARLTDILIGNEEHLRMVLGEAELESERLATRVLKTFPQLRGVAVTRRGATSPRATRARATWGACFHDRHEFCASPEYEVPDLVGRSGAGDAFAAGLIFSFLRDSGPREALEFASRASYVKHSVPGDFLRSSPAEVQAATPRSTRR